MDSTDDKKRPGSRSFDMKMGVDDLAAGTRSATGENIGPERKVGPYSEDTVTGNDTAPGGASTTELSPPLRGKPNKGSRLDETL